MRIAKDRRDVRFQAAWKRRTEPEVFNRKERIELEGTSLVHFVHLRGKGLGSE